MMLFFQRERVEEKSAKNEDRNFTPKLLYLVIALQWIYMYKIITKVFY